MNRRRKRATGQRRAASWTVPEVTQIAACPDCNADVTVTEVAPGVFAGTVEHDDTCPWFAEGIKR